MQLKTWVRLTADYYLRLLMVSCLKAIFQRTKFAKSLRSPMPIAIECLLAMESWFECCTSFLPGVSVRGEWNSITKKSTKKHHKRYNVTKRVCMCVWRGKEVQEGSNCFFLLLTLLPLLPTPYLNYLNIATESKLEFISSILSLLVVLVVMWEMNSHLLNQ